MSKRKTKGLSKKHSAAGNASVQKQARTPKELFPTPDLSNTHSNLRRPYMISLILFGIIMLFLAVNSGINADDSYQYDYSTKLVDYYSSFGKVKDALFIEKGTMHYYGGFFDILTGYANELLGFTEQDAGYHITRHIFIAIMGWFILFFIGRFSRDLGGWRAGLIAVFIAFLSPRLLGHSLMNPKDIPFAMGNIMALYYMFK